MGDRDRRKELTVRPFESLKEMRSQLRKEQKKKRRQQLEELIEKKPEPEPTQPPAQDRHSREASLFADAMADVVPLEDRPRVPKVHQEMAKLPRAVDERAAVDAYLRDLVDGVVPFDIADTDEYIEGAVQGFDRRVLRRLRRGEYSIQAHFDLHGHTRDEARAAVGKFIKRSHDQGHRCVLIVHGRGLNSKGQIPVLKEKLKAWLTRGSIGTKVLAFASARPYDGGTGAVYVLLRR